MQGGVRASVVKRLAQFWGGWVLRPWQDAKAASFSMLQ